MIRYALRCENSHEFEAWFGSSSAFDLQESSGQVACPQCGSRKVVKGVMAPNIATGAEKKAPRGQSPDDASSRNARPPQGDVAALARKVRDHVERTSDHVGERFAEEARKIHHKEAEPRGIYGSATSEEVGALKDEGIEFHPLPSLPEDHN